MPSQKRSFECTIEEALNEFWYEPDTDSPNKKRKRNYQPVPVEPSSPSSTYLTINGIGQHSGSNQAAENDATFAGHDGQQTIEHDLSSEALPVKGKVSFSMCLIRHLSH